MVLLILFYYNVINTMVSSLVILEVPEFSKHVLSQNSFTILKLEP